MEDDLFAYFLLLFAVITCAGCIRYQRIQRQENQTQYTILPSAPPYRGMSFSSLPIIQEEDENPR